MEPIRERIIRNRHEQEDTFEFDTVFHDFERIEDISQRNAHTFEDPLFAEPPPKPLFNVYEWALLLLLASAAFYAYFGIDIFACLVTRAFAWVGHPSAQYLMGQRYLTGTTVTRNFTLAIEWFHLAASKGHASASYNLAVSHFQGYQSGLAQREAMELLKYAATRGVTKAIDLLAICERDTKLCIT